MEWNAVMQSVQGLAGANSIAPTGNMAKAAPVLFTADEYIPPYSVFMLDMENTPAWDVAWNKAGIAAPLGVARVRAERPLYTNGPTAIFEDGVGWGTEIPLNAPLKMLCDDVTKMTVVGPRLDSYELVEGGYGFFAIERTNDPVVDGDLRPWWVVRTTLQRQCFVTTPVAGLNSRVGAAAGTSTCSIVMRATDGVNAGDFVDMNIDIEVFNSYFMTGIGSDGDHLVGVDTHFDGAEVLAVDCANTGTSFAAFTAWTRPTLP